jgi:hypothetical protein
LLKAFVSRNGMLLSELLQACVDDVTNWTENEQLEDDVTMMALKVG